MTFTVRRRVARKTHWAHCCYPAQPIHPGDVYLEHTEFPGGAAGHPVRMPECADCATRYGRGHLLDPTTEETK